MGREASVIDVGGDGAELSPAALAGAAGIVDALLGTGFSGAPREPISGAIAAINAARAGSAGVTVIACDVPSGVDGSTGEISADAVRADATVTFHAAKPGLWIAPGKRHAGHVHVIDIGIPGQDQPVDPMIGLIEAGVRELIPRRDAGSTKFSVGQRAGRRRLSRAHRGAGARLDGRRARGRRLCDRRHARVGGARDRRRSCSR